MALAVLLLSGLLFGVHGINVVPTYNCSFYDENNCTSGKNPNATHVGDDCEGVVEVCKDRNRDKTPEGMACYILFVFADNNTIQFKKKGCWPHVDNCQDTECRHYYHEGTGNRYCCCRGSLCNLHPGSPVPTPSEEPETPTLMTELSSVPSAPASTRNDNKKSIVVGIGATVGAVVLIAAAFVFGFWCWSRRQADEVGEDDCVEMTELEKGGAMERSLSGTPDPEIDLSLVRLIQKIGGGRFSEVWKADLNDDCVAVKIFPEHEKQSWNTEKDVYSNPPIRHENLRGFLASERRVDGDIIAYWMILDFHELGSLSDYLKAHVVTLDGLCKMAGSVAAGLAYLHSEIPSVDGVKPAIAHRDLKSRNVLVKTDGTCCICDLGLSIKFQPGTSLTEAQGQVGTVRYMAPEVLEGAITFNRESFLRIDVYALGLVIWEMMIRCTAKGDVCDYKQPFEDEVGLHPNMEQMKNAVVTSRVRPRVPQGWDCVQPLESMVETVEECWDHDAEARLTAQCVEERANWCLRYNRDDCFSSPSTSYVQMGETMTSPARQNGAVNYPVDTGAERPEQTGQSDLHSVPLCNGHVKSQTQPISGQILNGIRQVQVPIYPQDRSASPPPYSAMPLPSVNYAKMNFKVVVPRSTPGNSDSSTYAETSL